ncbi:patatin [Alicycliphilus sp. B1]|nr:patatin [Alicycliphilus sp. B1]
MALARRAPRLGLALGSGSARGWAHIGVLQVLQEEGIRPDVVCGSSIGALVGAAYAAGELERFGEWVLGLGMRDVFGFMDFNLAGGMLKGEKLIAFWRRNFADFTIEDSPLPFGAVATDLHSGAEVWLREGSIADAGARLHRAAGPVHARGARRRPAAGRWRPRQSRACVARARHGGRHRHRRGPERRTYCTATCTRWPWCAHPMPMRRRTAWRRPNPSRRATATGCAA